MSSTSPQPKLPPSDLRPHRFHALRAELDRIDDELHDGLMRRAEIVAEIGALGAKGGVPLRPGREASIIRRLLGRNRPPLQKATVVRIWRELLAGSTAQQRAMLVAVGSAALEPVAREHFGALTPVAVQGGAEAALDEVRRGEATAGVVPMPGEGERWWVSLMRIEGTRLSVVARLPFWARRQDGVPGAEALVVSAAAPDPSGDDRTLLGFATGEDGHDLGAALMEAGLRVVARAPGALLAEMGGFVDEGDVRLTTLGSCTVIGAYAVPVGEGA